MTCVLGYAGAGNEMKKRPIYRLNSVTDMRHLMEIAPRDENVVILDDEAKNPRRRTLVTQGE